MFKQWSCALAFALCAGVALADSQPRGNKPIVYLTFDDGPSSDAVTEMVLDVLARHDAKATFFVTGARARANPDKILQIIDAGHALGNHTMTHANLLNSVDHKVAEELGATNDYVLAAGAPPLTCFRAPFGATNQRVNNVASSMGLRNIGWTIDTRDWDPYTESEEIAIQLADSQRDSIVLMHDGPQARWKTLNVFTDWMEDVAGLYEFRSLPACSQPTNVTYAAVATEPEIAQTYEVPAKSSTVLEDATVLNASLEDATIIDSTVVEAIAVSAITPAAAAKTIPDLISKLNAYQISLQPEVIAQNGVSSISQN